MYPASCRILEKRTGRVIKCELHLEKITLAPGRSVNCTSNKIQAESLVQRLSTLVQVRDMEVVTEMEKKWICLVFKNKGDGTGTWITKISG
jgi:hypothetical protein